ncbi:unnamed protein product, partial [Ectocarpus sp. 12 AP-2014]
CCVIQVARVCFFVYGFGSTAEHTPKSQSFRGRSHRHICLVCVLSGVCVCIPKETRRTVHSHQPRRVCQSPHFISSPTKASRYDRRSRAIPYKQHLLLFLRFF